MRMVRSLLLLLLLVSSATGQQIQYSSQTLYSIAGIEGWEAVGQHVLVPSGSKPVLRPVGRVSIDEPYDSVSIIAERASDLMPVPVESVDDQTFLVFAGGKIRIIVTVANQDPFLVRTYTLMITVDSDNLPGPEPDKPEPVPPPDVPADSFDNIGQRIAAAAKGLSHNPQVGDLYAKWADSLEVNPALTITDASNGLSKELLAIPGYGDEYRAVRDLLNADIRQRWPMSGGVLVDYWRAVAAGYKGAK